MQTIFWAFGSMIIIILFITFTPLGFTLKGKFIIILASFVLGIGGLAAISSFPLWETLLMIAALIFLTAYFMNKHIGTAMFKDISSSEELLTDEDNFADSVPHININNDSLNLSKVSIVEPTLLNLAELETENAYLSDIETLLVKASEVGTKDQNGQLEEIDDISTIYSVKIDSNQNHPGESDLIEDPLFDFLLLSREVAVGQEDIEVINTKKR